MSIGGLRARQILALGAVVAAIVVVSLTLEVAGVVRAALDESRREAQYVSQSVVLQVSTAVTLNPGTAPYQTVANDPQLRITLDSATQFAPTVLYAAVCDSQGVVITHNDASRVGTRLHDYPPLPDVRGFFSSWRFLGELWGGDRLYEQVTPLRMGERPFGTVRVALSSTFIIGEVRRVVRRGILLGLGEVLLAMAAALFLTRIVVGPIREVRRGIEALRAGDFDYRIPQQGIDEFAGLAVALNELSDQFRTRETSGGNQGDALRHAMEHLGDGLLVVSADREVTHVNGIAARHLGLMGDEALGRSIHELFPEGHPVRRIADDLLGGRSDRVSVRTEFTASNGNPGVMAVGHRVHDGSPTPGILIELKDLSALAELQAVMDHSTVLSRLGEMAAGVAHEIRNPLNAITLHLEPLRHTENLGAEEVRSAVDATREEITRLDRAVSGFLKVARLQRLTMSPVDPGRLAREVHKLLAPEAVMSGLDLNLECDGSVPLISGDAEVLRQALLNLVKNAIQAQPSRDGKVTISCRADGESVRLAVHDSGPGIPADVLPRIFDLYMTTKDGGTGVGLAFVRQAVEMHRGHVTVESDAESGTTVGLWMRAHVPVEAS